MNSRLSREAVARREIGVTDISGSLKLVLTLFFLGFIFAVPLGQSLMDLAGGKSGPIFVNDSPPEIRDSLITRVKTINDLALHNMSILENHLEENSWLRRACLPPLQYLLTRYLRQGNEKVVVGRNGYLHYGPGLEALIGPPFLDAQRQRERRQGSKAWEIPVQPDPLQAILDFRHQLAERGIDLLLVVAPSKPAVEPWTLSTRAIQGPVENRSLKQLKTLLKSEDIPFVDPRDLLRKRAERDGESYLRTDTHWTPRAMEEVAAMVADMIRKRWGNLVRLDTIEYQELRETVSAAGDIARMLVLPEGAALFPAQEVEVRKILTPANEFWQPDREAEILLLGDSFTNIYSMAGLGWGTGAGLGEQLSRELSAPLDLLARNDNGAYVTREMLATELGRGRDRLAGKKLVIWEFSERELALGNWKQVELKLQEPAESAFFHAPPGKSVLVTGTVVAISRSARPGSVPYRDNILTLHLADMVDEQGNPLGQAIVYGWGMRDNRLTPLAFRRSGERLSMELVPWEDRETELGGYRRSPLDDEMLELELPNWGELRESEQEH